LSLIIIIIIFFLYSGWAALCAVTIFGIVSNPGLGIVWDGGEEKGEVL
jgi:hypothetical protein